MANSLSTVTLHQIGAILFTNSKLEQENRVGVELKVLQIGAKSGIWRKGWRCPKQKLLTYKVTDP